MTPIIIVNFKTYPQATGAKAITLAKLCEEVAREHKADIRVAVQATDLTPVSLAVKIPVYAQHVDLAQPGKSTGWVTAQALQSTGAAGTLLNHSEHRISTQAIRNTAQHLRKAKLDIVVIAKDLPQLHEFDKYVDADLLCIEPPELIAGEVSVAVARPDIVKNAVHATSKPLLVGAGVRDHNDLSIALEMGAAGVLISSHIVLARDQRKALQRLIGRSR